MDEKRCKNCHFGKPAGYRQVICQKRNSFQAELYSCDFHVPKECEYRIGIPDDTLTVCGAYSKSIRPDGRHWAHYPKCSEFACPIIHPHLLEGAVLKGEK